MHKNKILKTLLAIVLLLLTNAWDGGSDESFDVMQRCEQCFSVHALSQLVETLQSEVDVNAAKAPEAFAVLQ